MPKRGTVREDGKIFIKMIKGKEFWGSQEQWDNNEKWRKEYMEKQRNHYRTVERKYKIGEYNPENGLYFMRLCGNYKPIWATFEQVEAYKAQRKEIKQKYKARMMPNKENVILGYGIRRRRGDYDPILNIYFYKYNSMTGKEIWLDKERFDRRIRQEKEARKNRKSPSLDFSSGIGGIPS